MGGGGEVTVRHWSGRSRDEAAVPTVPPSLRLSRYAGAVDRIRQVIVGMGSFGPEELEVYVPADNRD